MSVSHCGCGPQTALGQDELRGSCHLGDVPAGFLVRVSGSGFVGTTVLVHAQQGVDQHCFGRTAGLTLHLWKRKTLRVGLGHCARGRMSRFCSPARTQTFSIVRVLLVAARARLRPIKALGIGTSVVLHQHVQGRLS